MTMKSGQLIEHNIRIFSFENSCTKCGGETFLRPFLRKKKSQLSISLSQQSDSLYSLLLLYVQVAVYQNN